MNTQLTEAETHEFFRERRERADPAALGAWLKSRPNVPPMPGDELTPELAAQVKAWLDVKEMCHGCAYRSPTRAWRGAPNISVAL